MKCEILVVGKVKEHYFADGIAEYLKRLTPVFPVVIREVPDKAVQEGSAPALIKKAVDAEGEALLNLIDDDTFVVALAIDGKQLASPELAAKLNEWSGSGMRRLAFIIGGSWGLSLAVLKRADYQLSFGKATYPHQLMRLILTEQIYRAVRINRNEPYHK